MKISTEEIGLLASYLGMSNRAFRGVYTRRVKGYTSLREKENYDCIFYDGKKGCKVYQHRPRQCRTWPFWKAVVDSEDRWEEEAGECPGINHGELQSSDLIALTIIDDGTSGYIPKRKRPR